MIKISVITVTYNCEALIDRTIQSILSQTYPHSEYIIIDGASTDRTLDIIEKYKNDIDFFKSEPDSGVYDAMNKALKFCTGDYINFLNAGDIYKHENVLTCIADRLAASHPALLYGLAEMRYKNKDLLIGNPDISKIKICHQAAFYKPELHKKYGNYNLTYRIVADRDFFTKLYLGHEEIIFENDVYIDYLYEGLTTNNYNKRIFEELTFSNTHFPKKIIKNYLVYYIKFYLNRIKGIF